MRPLVWTWLALMVLLVLTAVCARLPLGVWNTVISLAIAVAKTGLVTVVFMKLRHASALIRLAAVVGLTTLALLLGLSATDYSTRPAAPAPWQQPSQVPPRL
jgi:cytochrome c oxidase subunit 4